jgi:hypothetical protein
MNSTGPPKVTPKIAKGPKTAKAPARKAPKPPKPTKTAKKPTKTAKKPIPSKRPAKTAKNPKNPRGSQPVGENGVMNTMASQPGSVPKKGVKGTPGAPQASLVEVQNAAKSLKEVLNLADGKMTRLQQALSEVS